MGIHPSDCYLSKFDNDSLQYQLGNGILKKLHILYYFNFFFFELDSLNKHRLLYV